jgi:hypothetical protein
MSRVLISFCNQGIGRPSLAVCDTASPDQVSVIDLTDLGQMGAAGLLRVGDEIIVALQPPLGQPTQFVVLDAATLQRRAHWSLTLAVDPHSLAWRPDRNGGRLYVASTGSDELIEVELRGDAAPTERVVWRPEGADERTDQHHINSVAIHQGRLIVAGFWPRTATRWASARNGRVVVIDTGEMLLTDLWHPHSLVTIDSDLWLCESSRAGVRMVSGTAALKLPGYTRGLCALGSDQLVVGTSIGRATSRSLGIANPSDPGKPVGKCQLVVVDRTSLAPVQFVDLGALSTEIYDLLPLDG